MSAERPAGRLGYMPGVDGLRALAVTAVLVYHLGAAWFPGGYLGVDVFFVISGFLITSLLLAEHRAKGRIDLRRFWLRRARRLLPAVLLMLAVVLAVMLVLHPSEVSRMRGEVLAALGYVINWYFIFADVPYFEQFGRPSVLLHLWSLAIEEQFYLLWPPLLAAGLLIFRCRGLLMAVGLLAAGSTALAWVLWRPFEDPSRIYYGTDTRAVALLVGVGLALVPAAVRRAPPGARAGRLGREALGAACLGGVLVAMLTLGDLDERLYRGGFLLVALATAGLIAVVASPASLLGRLFATRPLVWLGLRSYAIYLWHWPVIMLTRPNVDVPFDGPPLVALRITLTLAAAALSYRFVEVPFRRHGIAGVRAAMHRLDVRFGRPARLATASSAALALAALVVAVAAMPASPPSAPGLAVASAGQPERPLDGAAPTADARPVLFVGDSVMLGAAPELRRAFGPHAIVDAAVGRRFPEGARIVLGRLRGLPPDAPVVIHLGNNYFVDPQELDALMSALWDRPRVVLVTVRVPLDWEESVNEALLAASRRHPNVMLLDWHARSGESGLLVDGAHMSPRGMRLYTALLRSALEDQPSAQPATT